MMAAAARRWGAGQHHPQPAGRGRHRRILGARRQGRPLRLTPTSGGDLRLQGRSGDLYRLAFSNRGRRTVEVVATVDGLDVLNGRPGSIANRGYVVRPGDMLVIEGFRKSEDEVAAFRFSAPDDAYAANTPQGDPRNIGVIGVALFTLDDPAERDQSPPRPGRSRPTRRATRASRRRRRRNDSC